MHLLFNKKIVQMGAIRGGAVLVALWLQIWLVARFGAAAYGEYVFFVTLCSLVAIVSKGGLDTLALKAAAIAHGSADGHGMRQIRLRYLWRGFVFTLITSFVLYIAYSIIAVWREGLPPLSWGLICFASVGGVLFQILVALARGQDRPALADAFDAIIRTVVMAAIAIVLMVAYHAHAMTIIISYALSFYLASLLLYRLTAVAPQGPAIDAVKSGVLDYGARAHFGFMLAGLLAFVFFQLDTLILGMYISPVELGAYNMACNLVRAVIFVPMILVVLVQPRIAVAFEKADMGLVVKIAVGAVSASVATAASCSILLWLLGDFILRWIDPVFVSAVPAMLILAIAHVVNSALIIIAGIVSMTSKYLDVVRAQLVGSVVALACYALLIPTYGSVGAALSMFAGLLVVLACYVFMYRKHLPKLYGFLLSKTK